VNLSEVEIGNQIWMTQNLDVKTFQNGENIPFYHNIQDFLKAGRHQEPACCYYENNPQKGMLYNWFALNDERGIAPESFKVPTKNDWEELIKCCCGKNTAAIHLKSSSNWIEPQNAPKPTQIVESEIGNGLDSFGFNALPMGSLVKTKLFAEFFGYGSDANFWTSDTDSFYSGKGFGVYLYYFSPRIIIIPIAKRTGISIRCVKEKL
jgi:uncharacterized protein (TIGR02145 family)